LKDFPISSVLLYGAIPMADFQREPKQWIMAGYMSAKLDKTGEFEQLAWLAGFTPPRGL